MALEQLANNAQTTTTGAIDGATNPVTFTVASATNFPTSGNFRVLIDSEILKVTSVSGTSFTASRAQEGTTISSHLSGATVTCVLTKGSVQQILTEMSLSDLAANRPAAGTKGRLFFPSDGTSAIFRDNGTAWECYANGLGPFTPPIGDFTTWVNQGTRGAIDESSGITVFSDNGPSTNSNFLMLRVKSAPATPWKMTMAYRQQSFITMTANYGICCRDSSTGRITVFATGMDAASNNVLNATVLDYTNATTFHANTQFNPNYFKDMVMMRIVNDGTKISWQFSCDFRNWYEQNNYLLSGLYAATIDQVGFYLNNVTAANVGAITQLAIYHAVLG